MGTNADAEQLEVEVSPVHVLPDVASVTLAREYLRVSGSDPKRRSILWYWRDDFFEWQESAYRRLVMETFRAKVHVFLKSVRYRKNKAVKLFQPEPKNVDAVIKTLQCECQAHVERMPAWVGEALLRPSPEDCIAFANGILDLNRFNGGDSMLIPPTPEWFSETTLPYEIGGLHQTACPNWMAFLNSTIQRDGGADTASIELLQEWIGYSMTADTRHQKLMLLVGPPRCGKGTIIRQIQRVVGQGNFVAPTFDSLADRFGLEPLLGKRVATIPDAHIGRSSDAIAILDKLLQISGEDAVTVARKFKSAVPGVRLGVRFTIAANEPPDLPDASGAIVSRLLTIEFFNSFVGKEDLTLDARLTPETPAIALWALEGLRRLRRNGRFTCPEGAERLKNDIQRQNAPIEIFLQECCEVGTTKDHWSFVDQMWERWKSWSQANGHHPGTKEGMGRRLRSARPRVYKHRVMRNGLQKAEYAGVRLVEDGMLRFGSQPDYNADTDPDSYPL